MKVACEACGARYAIPDEKVRGSGRTFKVTCRKCNAPIMIRGVSNEEAPEPPVWYYAVGQERQGPIDVPALRTLLQQGTIVEQTFVWRQGMSDWQSLREIEELASLCTPAPSDSVPTTPQAALYAHNL